MKVVSFINRKGGPGKTTTAVNTSYILATNHAKRVLLVDNDYQGNATDHFGFSKDEINTIADVLLQDDYDIYDAIYSTQYKNLDLLGANMRLLSANLRIITDQERRQEIILRTALEKIKDRYDYCIIDNGPEINISVINALMASDEVIVPVKIDDYSFSGLANIVQQIEDAKALNTGIMFKGCLVTQFARNDINLNGKAELKRRGYPVFNTHIRRTEKVDESTFYKKPITEYSPRCGAAKDYIAFVKECFE